MCQLVVLRSAVAGDLATVAAMNQRLVEDQGSRNPFSSVEYQQRLKDWLAGDEWEIALFIDPNGDILGYAVYKVQGDYYYPDQEVVYLRQFFIDRPHRGQGAAVRLTNSWRTSDFSGERFVWTYWQLTQEGNGSGTSWGSRSISCR